MTLPLGERHQIHVKILNATGAAYAKARTARRGSPSRPRRSSTDPEFNATTLGILGSRWGWLGYNTQTERLEIATTANQDPRLSLVPIIGVDIWEHAFYLQYLNVKANYLTAVWNVIHFEKAEARYLEASCASNL
ncbi:hypothetical protein FA13DRAFT_1766405 [Coprinellus micaceus]|uniref:superoxide dismutase n=1 Tax=Coprinellus micaceus TaxID=71717 RepID=A0A4Y7SLI6_COPMI|nr:hypothetical protein FA13DRAFT_1766405 [Coprinellus micaceus]